jgi:hypothetical protein
VKPSQAPRPLPGADRSTLDTIAEGMGIGRRILFQSPVTHDGWHSRMLTHIAAAKQLGFTMFEIDTTTMKVPRPKQREGGEDGAFYMSILGMPMRRRPVEGDEWKEPTDADSDTAPRTMDAIVVTVYALAVE